MKDRTTAEIFADTSEIVIDYLGVNWPLLKGKHIGLVNEEHFCLIKEFLAITLLVEHDDGSPVARDRYFSLTELKAIRRNGPDFFKAYIEKELASMIELLTGNYEESKRRGEK